MSKLIQTFGYEGLSISQFIAHLKRRGTVVVVDVRANPLSRKPGFSKRSFSEHLYAAGIEYVHAVGVGCPKAVRDKYRNDADWSAYSASYKTHLKTRQNDVEAIAEIAVKATTCLVCFEADYARCHRSFVAEAVAAIADLTVEHLTNPAIAGAPARTAA